MLKRIHFIIFSYFITSGIISGQTLSIGPMVGANFMTISNTSNSKTLTGLSLGIFGNYSINEHIGVNAKLLYSQMGTGLKNSQNLVRLNYIQLPLSAVYFFGDTGDKLRPKLFAGPYVSFLLNALDVNGNKIVYPNGENIYLKTDIGGVLGAGLNFTIAERKWLNIDATYCSSFSGIVDAPNSSNKNTGFQLNIGISFPIGN